MIKNNNDIHNNAKSHNDNTHDNKQLNNQQLVRQSAEDNRPGRLCGRTDALNR